MSEVFVTQTTHPYVLFCAYPQSCEVCYALSGTFGVDCVTQVIRLVSHYLQCLMNLSAAFFLALACVLHDRRWIVLIKLY